MVICGAVYKAFLEFQAMHDEYVSFLKKGQIPGSDLLKTAITVQLIYSSYKYNFVVKRSGPKSFLLLLEGSDSSNVSDLLEKLNKLNHVLTCYFCPDRGGRGSRVTWRRLANQS